jgi:FkbM family methyltransferase
MSQQIKTFDNGLKLLIDDNGSSDQCHILKLDNIVEDYIPFSYFDIKPGDTVIDIGAHIGRFSVYAAFRSKTGRVYAFEPDPRNYERLKENIKLNSLDNIIGSEKIVNQTGDRQSLYLSADSAENSLYAGTQSLPAAEIAGISLPQIFALHGIGRCDFLKSDCEGAEYDILFSLPPEYFSKIDKIALEYHDNLYQGKSLKDLVFLLSKNNFVIHRVSRGAWYIGLLYASRSRASWRKPLTFLHNYFQVYVIDLIYFTAALLVKKIYLFFNKK